jgi:hypothetical protein
VVDVLKRQIRQQGRTLLATITDIALALPDAQVGAELMEGFKSADFTPPDAKVVAQLERSRGAPWMRDVMTSWIDSAQRSHFWVDLLGLVPRTHKARALHRPWPQPLVAFAEACLEARWSDAVLKELLQGYVAMLSSLHTALTHTSPSNRLALRDELLATVCELAEALRPVEPSGGPLLHALLTCVSEQPRLYPLDTLAPLLISAAPAKDAQFLRTRVIDSLRTLLAETLRDPTDYALRDMEWRCRCKDCTVAITWAESPSGHPLELAIGEPRRKHVESQIEWAGAPVTMKTLKLGSPYRLVLTKPTDLRARDQVVRKRRARDLAMLESLAC